MKKVVLYRPLIPQNTGNIIRTCKVTGSSLVLVKPLGFKTDNKHLKRAGLDYFEGVDVKMIDDLHLYLLNTAIPFYFLSSKANVPYTDVEYPKDVILIFGSETAGLSPLFCKTWPKCFLTIPMIENSRCLNLSSSVAIVLYEVWRQHQFHG
jgi:tRNA (cytidine/uridine-2'-O-)-methyltransferase